MNTNLINIPTRTQKGQVITPWEYTLFKQIATYNSDTCNYSIQVDKLITAYKYVMNIHKLPPLSSAEIIKLLEQTHLLKNNSIDYGAYNKSLRSLINIDKYYNRSKTASFLVSSLITKRPIDWNKQSLVIVTLLIDVIAALLIVWLKMGFSSWLILARTSAVIILTNLAYLLIPFTFIINIIPNEVLAWGFPSEYSDYYHKVFGFKILIASITHTIGHIGQIESVLKKCKNGCRYEEVFIIPKSNTQIVISHGYFMKQYAYVTGIILVIIFSAIVLSLWLEKKKWIRYSLNQLLHKYLACLGIIMTIVHGFSHLLGFNYSYIFTLPLFLFYCWRCRHEIIHFHVRINRWVITPTMVRLYLQDDSHLDKLLTNFSNVTVYVNYSKLNKFEWHPFTLSRGYNSTDAVLTMKRIGQWTNSFANILRSRIQYTDHINISHCVLSKFRFHRLYKTRYFFCAGIGITAFMASMMDMIRNPLEERVSTTLVWSVADMEIIREFNQQLMDIQYQLSNIKIMIFYSNKSKTQKTSIPPEINNRFLYLQAIIYGSQQYDIISKIISPICCIFQRANFIEILAHAVVSMRTQNHKQIGVFICGSAAYAKQVCSNVDTIKSNKHKVTFRTWSESV